MSARTTTAAAAVAAPPPLITSSSSDSDKVDISISLGFLIAAPLCFLFLLSALFVALFYFLRRPSYRIPTPPPPPTPDLLPRVIFVTESDDEDEIDPGINRSPKGLDPAAISSFPKFPFNRGKNGAGENAQCSICLCEYKEGEMLRTLPYCRHFFHLSCVDAWLRLNASCPVCRTSPMPTPLSTPLSEIVPLSLYAADRRRR